MNVLSLFDGMSCGQLALDRAGVSYNKYFASEIDKYAIKVAKCNYPETVHIGNVENVYACDIPKISLLLGGSPCQCFSSSGNRSGFTGASELFWEYVRLLEEVQPEFFLLENVIMKKEWEDIITGSLGVDPIAINSSIVCGANRPRVYWTNIPQGLALRDTGTMLVDVLENLKFTNEPYIENYVCNRPVNYMSDKFKTLRASAGSRTRGLGICDNSGWWRKLTPVECERLQTVPDGYTKNASTNQRYKMLGNGWTVDVIAHLLKGCT